VSQGAAAGNLDERWFLRQLRDARHWGAAVVPDAPLTCVDVHPQARGAATPIRSE
jgi:hypothetical protein